MPLVRLLREIGAMMSIEDLDISLKHAVSKENNGTIEWASTPKMRLRTKHAAIKVYHFGTHVSKRIIKITKVDVTE